ncbi:hypothetical protein QQF64_001635 [Cirrhinus molitorella]|uniref:Yippee domain-containing protein n=1 Tax=Cirrhinus molitorella TaxID=172907 RepID=A0ABR3P132_9TELE
MKPFYQSVHLFEPHHELLPCERCDVLLGFIRTSVSDDSGFDIACRFVFGWCRHIRNEIFADSITMKTSGRWGEAETDRDP